MKSTESKVLMFVKAFVKANKLYTSAFAVLTPEKSACTAALDASRIRITWNLGKQW